MSDIPGFYNDRAFKKLKEQIERKTTSHKREELARKALNTAYFIRNKVAAQEILALLQPKEEKIKNITNIMVAKPKKEPVVMKTGESVSDLAFRLVQNGEYQKAMALCLSDENIKKHGPYARSVAKRYLEDEKETVANSIFEYLKKSPKTALTFAECANHLGMDKKDIARNIIIKWVQDIASVKQGNSGTENTNPKETNQKIDYFGRSKKLLNFANNLSKTPKQIATALQLIPIDTQVCYELMSGMERLGGCNKEIQSLYAAWNKASSKINGHASRNFWIISIYEKSLKPVNN